MPWFKVHTSILNSSINYELTLEQQAVWIKLLALAAETGGTGTIADGDGKPMPHAFLAARACVPLDVFEVTLEICQRTGRLSDNSHGITICKWKEYQSEYNRQKPYREAKKYGHYIETREDMEKQKAFRNGQITKEAYDDYWAKKEEAEEALEK
jgi:hypothetical protein